MSLLKTEPVRLYAVATSVLAVVAYYYGDLPVPLILGVVAAVLGLGEAVRSQVTPEGNVLTFDTPEEVYDALTEGREFEFDPEDFKE